MPSRFAVTCCMCHQAFRRSSPFAASSSASSFRFPRVGARMRASAIASRGRTGSMEATYRPGYATGVSREPLSLTTNGSLLERDAEALVAAGIQRVNVSIDSLQRDRFFQMTRRDSLPQVMRGLEAIARHPEVRPIKVNAVAMRGFTEEE